MNGAIAFSSKSKNVERALMFLDWIQSSQENYDLFMYGVEGKHYELKCERLTVLKDSKYNAFTYYPWLNYPFRNIEFDRISPKNPLLDDFKKTYMDFINTKTEYAPHEGFTPDYSKVLRQDSYRVQLISRINDALSKGTFKAENLDATLQDLKDAGAERIVFEIQKQLDDWITTNK